MISLSDEQMDIFLELVEIHLECFTKHYPEYNITYENVLELNHTKIIEGDEEFIDYILEQLMFEYKQILKREGTD
jgi:hypothetical protein